MREERGGRRQKEETGGGEGREGERTVYVNKESVTLVIT